MCQEVWQRYLCNSNGVEPFGHSTFLGTKYCSDKASRKTCQNETCTWVFAPLFSGICLRCVHLLYPEYFKQQKLANPENYMELLRHEELPMPDDLKRDFAILDQICTIFIAERVSNWLEAGAQPKKQVVLERNCYVIKNPSMTGDLEFMAFDELITQYIQKNGPAAMTPLDLETAMKDGMQRWMEVFRNNAGEMSKAFEKLKKWRFETSPEDDLFEQRFKVEDIIDFKV